MEDRDNNDFVLVRSRAREDADRLASTITDAEVIETPHADYRWRVRVRRASWMSFVAGQALAIDYNNFKNAVGERQGTERAKVYGEVWAVLLGLQP